MINHCALADDYHMKGYNCAQGVLAAFSDLTGLSEAESVTVAGCFGMGAGSGELCGAVTGAIMVFGLMTPADTNDPINSKLRAVAQGREFVKRFSEKFDAVRCEVLLPKALTADDTTPAAKTLGITDHCSILAVTAAEIVEKMLREREATEQQTGK